MLICVQVFLNTSNASTGNIIRHIIFLNPETYTAKTGIKKWTLECSCVPKRVGATFCSKTGPFLSCAPNKPSGGLCAQGGQGHILPAKQGRSFRVTPANSAPTRFSRGHILGKGTPRDRPPAQSLTWQNPALICTSRMDWLSWRILYLDTLEPGS